MSYDNDDNENIDQLKKKLLSEQQQENYLNGKAKNHDSLVIIDDGIDLNSKILNWGFADYIIKTAKKTVKCEDSLIRQLLYTGLSVYSNNPISIGIKAPTSEGKSYVVKEVVMKFFPQKDIWIIGSMSPKVIIRQTGKLVDGVTNEPLEPTIRELKGQISSTKDSFAKEDLKDQLQQLLENSKIVIDLSNKIFVFLEPPHPQTWEILKAILSHDAWEIEHPFVDKTEYAGTQVKRTVTWGWPVCIFCSAKDESKWDIWPEIQSRVLITSPNMSIQKYQESNLLTAQTMSLPYDIQQKIIVSDSDIELAKKCVLHIKQQILKLSEKKSSNPVWIPYGQILGEVLPAEKGPDMRILQRLFSFLNIIPLAKMASRQKLFDGNQELVIANLEDLTEVLHITQNISGIPAYKVKFYKDIFLPLFKSKSQPDEKDGKKEKIISVSTKELADYYKKETGKVIGTDNLRKTFLVELLNNDYIGELKSELDSRQFVYYPLMEFDDSQKIEIKLNKDINNNNNEGNIPKLSNLDQFDNFLHVSPIKLPKNCRNIQKEWLIYEILGLARYRIDLDKFSGPLADFLNNHNEFQLLDIKGNRLRIKEFIEDYEKYLQLIRYFFKPEISNYHNKVFGSMKLLTENEDKSCKKLTNSLKFDNLDTLQQEEKKQERDFMSVNHLAKVAEIEKEDQPNSNSNQTNRERWV